MNDLAKNKEWRFFIPMSALVIRVLIFLLICASTQAFTLVQKEKPVTGMTSVTETYWAKEYPNKIAEKRTEKVGLHLYQSSRKKSSSILFYLPGTNMNGGLSVVDENHNLWLYLAQRDVSVFTLDYRNHFLGGDDIEDVSFMKTWTTEIYVADAVEAIKFINTKMPDMPLFVSGFSRGAFIAYGVAGAVNNLNGLIALDGSFKKNQFEVYDKNEALKKLHASGDYAYILSKRRGWESRHQMMKSTYTNPEGPAQKEKYTSIGEQLSDTLYNSWGKGVLTNTQDKLSSITVLARLLDGYDRYYPTVQNIEGASIASQADDPSTVIDDHWGGMDLPIIYFGAAGMGVDNLLNGIFSAGKSGSEDVSIHVLENYGHLDVLVGTNAKTDVFEVIYQWMGKR